VANTGATKLSGLAGSDSISANFSAGSAGPPIVAPDTITVNSTVITFVASGATGNQLNVTDDISALLAKIDSLSGATAGGFTSTITAGSITLHSGKTADLSVTSSNSTAFAALGFTGTAAATRGGGGTIGTGQVVGNDNSTFLDESVAGGAVTTYDISGAPVNLQFRWAKSDSSALGPGHTDTWNMFYQVNANATGTQVAWQNVNTNFTFSAAGQMSPAIASITLTNAVVNGVALGSPVINFGTGGVTQFADANGNVQVNQIQQDGFPAGQLQSVGVSNNGRIVGNYSNGRNLDLAEISIATFNGTNFLKRVNGGAFEVTDESGGALFGKSGTIVGSSLEGSNTDIADEFTKLIVTQQAYSANTKVITTANSMVQDLLNVLR
jgi:flagellar hook protein FlgE